MVCARFAESRMDRAVHEATIVQGQNVVLIHQYATLMSRFVAIQHEACRTRQKDWDVEAQLLVVPGVNRATLTQALGKRPVCD